MPAASYVSYSRQLATSLRVVAPLLHMRDWARERVCACVCVTACGVDALSARSAVPKSLRVSVYLYVCVSVRARKCVCIHNPPYLPLPLPSSGVSGSVYTCVCVCEVSKQRSKRTHKHTVIVDSLHSVSGYLTADSPLLLTAPACEYWWRVGVWVLCLCACHWVHFV